MATTTALVSLAGAEFPETGSEYADLVHRREHCSVAPDVLEALEIDQDWIDALAPAPIDAADDGNPHFRFQVRICHPADDPTRHALYTVVAANAPPGTVHMGEVGLEKLGASDGNSVTLDSRCPHPTLSDADADTAGEFVERATDDPAAELIVIAPHGGAIETRTDDQAERVVAALGLLSRPASLWLCKGWDGALNRWHITSTDLNEVSFPGLAVGAWRGYAWAISFHGFTWDEGDPHVIVGGGAEVGVRSDLATEIAAELPNELDVVAPAANGGGLAGTNPRNIVNRLACGRGIQIEQSMAARAHWELIAETVAAFCSANLLAP